MVDATGTYGNPNWLGRGGKPALGERALRRQGIIHYKLPTPDEADCMLRDGGVIVVVGSGASAITTLALLRQRYTSASPCKVVWMTRRPGAPYTLIADDPLPQRSALHTLGNDLAAAATTTAGETSKELQVEHRGGVQVSSLFRGGDGEDCVIEVTGLAPSTDETIVVGARHVIAHVGYRPNTEITRELQVHYCWASEGPMKLAAARLSGGGGGSGDCLAQVSHGAATMLNPEPAFFVVGMKTYGRGSSFLLRIGHEQVQQIFSLLVGEEAAAATTGEADEGR